MTLLRVILDTIADADSIHIKDLETAVSGMGYTISEFHEAVAKLVGAGVLASVGGMVSIRPEVYGSRY